MKNFLKNLKNFFVDDTYAKVHALYLQKKDEEFLVDRKTALFSGTELGLPWIEGELLVYEKARVDHISANMDKYDALVYGWTIYRVIQEPKGLDGFVVCVKSI